MKSPEVLVIKGYDHFSSYLVEEGCRVLNLELIKTEPNEDLGDFEYKMSRIDDYQGLFITSPVAAKIFLRQLDASNVRFAGKVYVLGERANEVLEASGLNVVFRGSANTAEELIRSFEKAEFADKKLLFIRGEKSLGTIPQMLSSCAQIEEIGVYRTLESEPDAALLESVRRRLKSGKIDWICFFSPTGVQYFTKLFGCEAASKSAVAAIGVTTARYASAEGLTVDLISPRAQSIEFARTLIKHFKNH